MAEKNETLAYINLSHVGTGQADYFLLYDGRMPGLSTAWSVSDRFYAVIEDDENGEEGDPVRVTQVRVGPDERANVPMYFVPVDGGDRIPVQGGSRLRAGWYRIVMQPPDRSPVFAEVRFDKRTARRPTAAERKMWA